jgi:hypothetical protein
MGKKKPFDSLVKNSTGFVADIFKRSEDYGVQNRDLCKKSRTISPSTRAYLPDIWGHSA